MKSLFTTPHLFSAQMQYSEVIDRVILSDVESDTPMSDVECELGLKGQSEVVNGQGGTLGQSIHSSCSTLNFSTSSLKLDWKESTEVGAVSKRGEDIGDSCFAEVTFEPLSGWAQTDDYCGMQRFLGAGISAVGLSGFSSTKSGEAAGCNGLALNFKNAGADDSEFVCHGWRQPKGKSSVSVEGKKHRAADSHNKRVDVVESAHIRDGSTEACPQRYRSLSVSTPLNTHADVLGGEARQPDGVSAVDGFTDSVSTMPSGSVLDSRRLTQENIAMHLLEVGDDAIELRPGVTEAKAGGDNEMPEASSASSRSHNAMSDAPSWDTLDEIRRPVISIVQAFGFAPPAAGVPMTPRASDGRNRRSFFSESGYLGAQHRDDGSVLNRCRK